VTVLDDLTAADRRPSFSVGLVERLARGLGRFSRRGFLVRTAVVGSALAIDPAGYVLRPQPAYSRVCGPSSSCRDGYTVFCCTVNNGRNSCPPGTFSAGWWKARDSSWCGGGYRYIVDCNATCSSCSSGCGDDHICSSSCWSCSCRCGPTGTCDQRKHCCNGFRYGQCNTQVTCSGGVACRVVSCVPPYKWDNCTTTSLVDNATAEHGAPCLQGPGRILDRYDALGSNGSSLGASKGPERHVGDGRGRYVDYEHGSIYWTVSTGAHAVVGVARSVWMDVGGPRGVLGYPRGERVYDDDGAWIQQFEKGVLGDTTHSATSVLNGVPYGRWRALGAQAGVLGYPMSNRLSRGEGRWVQWFSGGAMADTTHSSTAYITGALHARWRELGEATGVLGCPVGDPRAGRDGRGTGQTFEHGQLWGLDGDPPHLLTGAVLDRWVADGGETGVWGYPLADQETSAGGGGQVRCERGVLVV
jgi:hypothetical protein